MPFKWDEHDVCYTSEVGGFVALDPRIDREERIVSWFDLSHARAFDLKVELLNKPDHFAFKDSLGRRFDLRPMTLKAWHSMSPTNKRFGKLEDLLRALRNSYNY